MFNFRYIFLFLLTLFSNSAFAIDYYWVTGRTGSLEFDSLSSACTAAAETYQGVDVTVDKIVRVNDTSFTCRFLRNGTPNLLSTSASRRGDSCPPDTEYNSETGECVPPPHQCETGDVIGPYRYSGSLVGGYVVVDPPAPLYACKNGCEYSRKGKSDACQSGAFGTFCSYSFVGTGAECTSSPDNDMGGDSGEGPNANDGGDGGVGAGDGGDGSGDGGNNDGGDGDDPADEFPEAPETSTAEGDAKESTLQEIKQVIGTLAKEDTAKKNEKNTKGILDSAKAGNALLGDILQAINDKPVGGGGGGSGDGEGEGEESIVTGGDLCDSPPVCTGDAVQCAILAQEFKIRCDAEDLNDFEKHKDKIENLFDDPKFELKESDEVEVESFITGHTRWLSSTCPADEQMSLRLNGGRTFSLSYQPLCNAADAISPLIIIIATLMATIYIGRSAGG